MAWETSGNDEWMRQQALRGRSHFPAANRFTRSNSPQGYRGIQFYTGDAARRNTNLNANPPDYGGTGQVIGTYEGGPSVESFNRVPPSTGPRLPRSGLATWQLPHGGTTTLPIGTPGIPGARLISSGDHAPVDLNAAYARGYGAPNPQPLAGGFLSQGGVAFPAEQLTPQQRGLYGFSGDFGQSFGEKFSGNNPHISGGLSLLGRAGTLGYNALASLMGGGQNQRSQQSQNYYAYNPSPVPQQPRRYFDF